MKSSILTNNNANENDDERTTSSLKMNSRQLITKLFHFCLFRYENLLLLFSSRRLTTSSDNETTSGKTNNNYFLNFFFLFLKDNSSLTWNMNIYLYEGARQRNVSMMLHALALGADKNFQNEHDRKRTPLIQTILNVCIDFEFIIFLHCYYIEISCCCRISSNK